MLLRKNKIPHIYYQKDNENIHSEWQLFCHSASGWTGLSLSHYYLPVIPWLWREWHIVSNLIGWRLQGRSRYDSREGIGRVAPGAATENRVWKREASALGVQRSRNPPLASRTLVRDITGISPYGRDMDPSYAFGMTNLFVISNPNGWEILPVRRPSFQRRSRTSLCYTA